MTKGLIRSHARAGVASGKLRPEERRGGRPSEPRACKRCGAVFRKRRWRRDALTRAERSAVAWVVCPACEAQASSQYLGRVVVDLTGFSDEAALRRRIDNVAARAGHTQPERRLVSVERSGSTLDILTTSEKLAHRIAGELAKTWRGSATYRWSDDGSLFARWRPARRV
jgi:NMD protein affecting ribosome stability and mRNA decay